MLNRIIVFGLILAAAGCTGIKGDSAVITQEPPGANCATGGAKVQVGGEAPVYVCNGAQGASGEQPVATPEEPGSNCPAGGVRIQVGGGTATYVCNGVAGADGTNGLDGQSASVTVEPAGANCPAGGLAVQVGEGPVSYACNGADGQSATVTPEALGANCSAGGVRIQVGSGAASFVCNGAAATSPCMGVPGLSVTGFTMSAGMPYTATVSTFYPGGLRALVYSFMGEGGYYVQAGASNQFTFVPNVSGGPYINYVMVSDGCQMAWGSLSGIDTPPADVQHLGRPARWAPTRSCSAGPTRPPPTSTTWRSPGTAAVPSPWPGRPRPTTPSSSAA